MGKFLTKIRGNFKSIIGHIVFLTVLVIICIGYKRCLASDFCGDVEIPAVVLSEGYPVALTGGEYRLHFVYSSETDRSFSIYNSYNEILYSDVMAAGQNTEYDAVFVNPHEDCRIYFDALPGEAPISCDLMLLHTDKEIYNDSTLKAVLLFVLACLAFIMMSMLSKHKAAKMSLFLHGFLMIALVIHTLPFWTNYVGWGYDGAFHCTRIAGIAQALAERQMPPSVYPFCYNGFGMIGRVYPQLFLYPVSLLRFLNVSVTGCFQILMILLAVASAVTMYLSMRSITHSEANAAFAAAVFVLAEYHLDDVYFRNAVGETIAMIFIPVVIAGIYNVITADHRLGMFQCVIGATGIIQSHVLSCVMVAVMVVLMLIFHVKEIISEKKTVMYFLIAGMLTVMLNAAVIIPIITYLRYGLNTAELVRDYSTSASNVFQAFDLVPDMLPSLGKAGIAFFAFLIMIMLFHIFGKKNRFSRFSVCMLLLGSVFCLFALNILPWKTLERCPVIAFLDEYIQFAYRYYGICTVCLVMGISASLEALSGMFDKAFMDRVCNIVMVILLLIVTVTSSVYIKKRMPMHDLSRISGGLDNSFVPEYMPEGATDACFRNTGVYTSNPDIEITMYEKHGTNILCQFKVKQEYNHIDFPLFYYPGYSAVYYVPSNMDGIKLPVIRGDEGRIRVVLPDTDEIAAVKIRYSGLWYFNIGYIISGITLLFGLIYIVGHTDIICFFRGKETDNMVI